MKRTRPALAAVLLASTVLLTGCWGPVQGTDAMIEESERVLTFTEDVIPHIADELDLTVIEATSAPYVQGGAEGSPRRFRFAVEGEFGGELPTQQELEDAMAAMGLEHSVTETMGAEGSDRTPWVMAYDADKTIKVQVLLVTGLAKDGFRFSVSSFDDISVSEDAIDEYFPDLVPEFDQSLVTPDAEPVQP